MPLIMQHRLLAAPRCAPRGDVKRLSRDSARFGVFCILVGITFAMGGGSRGDILSLAFLRPLAFLVSGYALLVAQPGDLRRYSWPLGLMACLAVLMALQLVPLPPALWSALPGRELYLRIAHDAGLPLGYRPLTLSPSRTLNALFSLSVPLAAVLITAVQSDRYRAKITTVLLFACGASVLAAIGQIAGPDDGPLYLYRITNEGFPVGLFANRNHQALLLVVLLVMAGDYHRRARGSGKAGAVSTLIMGMAALVVFALILVTGSRAGLLLGMLVLPVIAWAHARSSHRCLDKRRRGLNRAWWGATIFGLVALVGAALAFSRATSIDRLLADDALRGHRFERLPILAEMLSDHWPLGIGFGAFEGAYKRYELIEVLTPFIFNQAHNDWMQFPIEGGIPAAAILLAVVAWIVIQGIDVVRFSCRGLDSTRFTALVILVLIGLASAVDYPLRTPIFMLIGAVSFAELGRRAEAPKSGSH